MEDSKDVTECASVVTSYSQQETYEMGRMQGETDRACGIDYQGPWGAFATSAAASQGYLTGWAEQLRAEEEAMFNAPDTEDGSRFELDLEALDWFFD